METPQRTFKVKESIKLEDGAHKGEIVRVEYVDEPYQYVEIIVKVDDTELELKYGCPQNLSAGSKFGRLIESFGRPLKVSEEITEKDIEELFVGKKVRFVTMTDVVRKDGQQREYSRIADGSLRLQ